MPGMELDISSYRENVYRRSQGKQNLIRSEKKKLCPFVQNPFSGCYCERLDSQDIEKAIFFCCKNYTLCEFYEANVLVGG